MKTIKRNITIYDIAKEAGVSPSTVSRVLTGKVHVKEATRRKIEKIIKKYNYRPNALARSLYYKKSRMIGCILPDITNPFYSQLFSELEKNATANGYSIILGNSLNNLELESKYLDLFLEKQVDGIVMIGGRVNEKNLSKKIIEETRKVSEKVPLLTVNGKIDRVNTLSIIADEISGINSIIDHLVSLGHEKIGFLGGTEGITTTESKVNAFKKMLKEYNLFYNKEWDIRGDFSFESGMRCMERLLEAKNLPSAVICINDLVCIGAIKKAREMGLNVPKDMSFCGFDDISLANFYEPPLTTVNQNYKKLAEETISNLIKAINGEYVNKEVIVPTIFIPRSSTIEIE